MRVLTIEFGALNFAFAGSDQGGSLFEEPAAGQAELVGHLDCLLDSEGAAAVLYARHFGTIDADDLAHLPLAQPPDDAGYPKALPHIGLFHF